MPSQTLPSLKDTKLDAGGCSVWCLLLSAEAAASKEHAAKPKYRDEVVVVRTLGFFLLDFWNSGRQHSFDFNPYQKLCADIASYSNVENAAIGSPAETAAQHEKVCQLGLDYLKNFSCAYVNGSDAEPIPTPFALFEDITPPSFDEAKGSISERIKEALQTKKDAKDAALFRDGYRCAITGHYDRPSYAKYPEIKKRALEHHGALVKTQCAHLFSESAQGGSKMTISWPVTTAFAFLERFGLSHLVPRPLGGQVNSLFNILTMSYTLHSEFDTFGWWLEEPNTYDVCAADESFFKYAERPPRRVVLKVDPATVEYCIANGHPVPELPDSRLIAIRAACARVSHLSGAAEHIEEIIFDRETTTVLANDGGSADLLTSLLRAVNVRGQSEQCLFRSPQLVDSMSLVQVCMLQKPCTVVRSECLVVGRFFFIIWFCAFLSRSSCRMSYVHNPV
ncbi:hypothetical protein CPB85DRAFT_1220231 [Mucidula mucida]|nr:hypothetical protein CPB85DRAFT_1220231 [Mucidula mucida]